jgi:putative tricarboxylic transport membrane protein
MLLFFVGYGTAAQDIQLDFWAAEEAFNARTFPSLVAAGGAFFALLLLLTGGRMSLPEAAELDLAPLLSLLGLLIAFTLLIETLGFLLAGISLLTIAPVLLGERRWQLILPVAFGVVLGLYLLLSALEVYLDPGLLGWLL